ncbi:MAG: hypothetical protein M3461_11940 [Pseudomonadota bacterium]|nr:hypothetical protein [Pseudomonadota bacterium]
MEATGTGEGHDHDPATAPARVFPPLAALYETEVLAEGDQTTAQGHTRLRWYLWRDDQRVETRTVGGVFSEIWSRDSEGRISKEQVFPDDRAVVDYYPGDLAAMQKHLSWRHLQSLIDPQALGTHLKEVSSRRATTGLVKVFRGTPDGVSTEVHWLVSISLPLLIERRDQSRRIVTRLLETWPVDAAPVPRSKTETLGEYRRVDFADFGDKEKDPLVRKATRVAGRHHLHSHSTEHGSR